MQRRQQKTPQGQGFSGVVFTQSAACIVLHSCRARRFEAPYLPPPLRQDGCEQGKVPPQGLHEDKAHKGATGTHSSPFIVVLACTTLKG